MLCFVIHTALQWAWMLLNSSSDAVMNQCLYVSAMLCNAAVLLVSISCML